MEACALRDAAPDFEKVGAKIYGISTDDVASQAAFAKANDLGYPLLADPKQSVAKTYGVLMDGRPYARRVTFVVDAVRTSCSTSSRRVNVRKHGEEVVADPPQARAPPKRRAIRGSRACLMKQAFKALHELKHGCRTRSCTESPSRSPEKARPISPCRRAPRRSRASSSFMNGGASTTTSSTGPTASPSDGYAARRHRSLRRQGGGNPRRTP